MWPAGQRLGLTHRRPGLRLPQAWAWHTSPPLTTRVSGGQAPPRDPPAQGNRVPRLPGGREEPPAAWPQLRVEGLRAGAGAGTAQGDPVGLASGLCVSRESSHTRSGRSGWVQSAALLGAAAWAPREARRWQRLGPTSLPGGASPAATDARAPGGAGASGVSPTCSWGVAQPLAAGPGCTLPTEEQGARGQGTAQPLPATRTLPRHTGQTSRLSVGTWETVTASVPEPGHGA